jgi:predicted nucleotidyltransferase|tara:strand:+ start:282 stop:482 length:201 start_codon:yes stop_codon:yes gene_type:complete
MQSNKWHNISIKRESFNDLKEIQKAIPIRASIPQTIEWLIQVGINQINSTKEENTNYEDSTRIYRK